MARGTCPPSPSQRERSDVRTLTSSRYCGCNVHPCLLLVPQLKKEMGLPESNHSSLPCLSSDSQLPHINGSAILPYFRAIRPLSDKNTIDKIIEQLDKLKFQREPEAEVSMPADNFERKNFILAVLQQFSACLEHVLQSLNSGPQ